MATETAEGRKIPAEWYPTFSNVLLHVNGAKLDEQSREKGVGTLEFDEESAQLNFSVIDGQHRVNGAYFAVCLLRESDPQAKWEIPAEIFIDLDEASAPPADRPKSSLTLISIKKKWTVPS